MLTLVRLLQSSNALSSIILTVLGRITLVIPFLPLNAKRSIFVTGAPYIVEGKIISPLIDSEQPVIVASPLYNEYCSLSIIPGVGAAPPPVELSRVTVTLFAFAIILISTVFSSAASLTVTE